MTENRATDARGLGTTLLNPSFLAWAVLWGALSFIAFGLVSAIIPNPVFGRQIPPEPFSIWIWIASAPLMGLIGATYTASPPPGAVRELPTPTDDRSEQGSVLGMVAGLGAFLAIGCPVCNKIVLLLLGTSGAMTIWAPIQPVVGVASVALLVAALAWRLRVRARGGACSA
jgi:hypothetical protein